MLKKMWIYETNIQRYLNEPSVKSSLSFNAGKGGYIFASSKIEVSGSWHLGEKVLSDWPSLNTFVWLSLQMSQDT